MFTTTLSSYVNYSVINLNNRITSTNNLLIADFNTAEAIAYAAVSANFANVIGALVEAYMTLNLRTRVSTLEGDVATLESATYLTSDFLHYPAAEYAELEARTRWIVTSNDLMNMFDNDMALVNIEASTDAISTRNQILGYVNAHNRADVEAGADYLTSLNEISGLIDSTVVTEVLAGSDYLTSDAYVAKTYATTATVTGIQTEVSANTTAIATLQDELVTLGIAQIVNGLFSFIDTIVSDAVLSAQIATCFKLSGAQTLTSNITSGSADTYLFYGAKPSQISYLSNVT